MREKTTMPSCCHFEISQVSSYKTKHNASHFLSNDVFGVDTPSWHLYAFGSRGIMARMMSVSTAPVSTGADKLLCKFRKDYWEMRQKQ